MGIEIDISDFVIHFEKKENLYGMRPYFSEILGTNFIADVDAELEQLLTRIETQSEDMCFSDGSVKCGCKLSFADVSHLVVSLAALLVTEHDMHKEMEVQSDVLK